MGFSATDGIIPFFPSSSAITAASGESNPFRRALRHHAAIFRVGNLESAIPRGTNRLRLLHDDERRHRPVSRPVLYDTKGGE